MLSPFSLVLIIIANLHFTKEEGGQLWAGFSGVVKKGREVFIGDSIQNKFGRTAFYYDRFSIRTKVLHSYLRKYLVYYLLLINYIFVIMEPQPTRRPAAMGLRDVGLCWT